ncbi:MAG: hypothetical protein U9Q74_05435 [Gemmatimonadota bacterium]|nr:hypothetical protein [Gemmatimonadota bacterium]
MHRLALTAGLSILLHGSAPAQAANAPLAFSRAVKPASAMAPPLRTAVTARAGRYPFDGYALFGTDSVLLVFTDSSYTAAGERAGTWMFGPPVTAAEADGCPPPKVLGRQIARALFRAMGRPPGLQQVVVSVHGTAGGDRWSVVDMYFYPEQLSGKWAGDSVP